MSLRSLAFCLFRSAGCCRAQRPVLPLVPAALLAALLASGPSLAQDQATSSDALAATSEATQQASTDLVQIEAPERDLLLVSWGGRYAAAQEAALIAPFAREQDTVKLVPYKGTLESLERVKGDWDLVDVELEELEEACALGLVAPLDPKQVGLQAGELVPGALHRCGLASQAWSWSFYAPTLEGQAVSVEGFLDPELLEGTRGLYRRPDGLLEMLLLSQGLPADQVYATLTAPGGPQKALAALEPLKDSLLWYHASADLEAALAKGELDFAFGFTAALERARAKREDAAPGIAPARSPILYGLDFWAIRAGSPNQEAAYAFLRHAISPAAGAAFARRLAYLPTRVQAYAGLVGLPSIPKASQSLVFDRLWWQTPAGLVATQAFEAWID